MACWANFSALEFAVKATTFISSAGARRTKSSVLSPIDPVEPNIVMRLVINFIVARYLERKITYKRPQQQPTSDYLNDLKAPHALAVNYQYL